MVEITSEEEEFPIESALVPGEQRGWRAAVSGAQTLPWPLLSVCLGLRISEALAFRWADVDWLGPRISVRRGIVEQVVDDVKTEGSVRTFDLAGELLDRLKSA